MYAPEKKVSDDKLTVTPLDAWTVPLGGQEIALQQVDFAVGGMSLLRTRIREGRRFTIFDVDPATARHWGEALCRWAAGQPGGAPLRAVSAGEATPPDAQASAGADAEPGQPGTQPGSEAGAR
jgi:hypothetical protein